MLRQIEWGVKDGPIKKNGVLPVTTFFFENLILVEEPLTADLIHQLYFHIFVST